MHPSVLTAPGDPGAAEPVADGGDPTARVRDAVIQLTRLVQRAAIYPPGHPTVRLALAPFFDALQRLPAHERLLIVVLRDRLMVSAGTNPPREHQSRWLAGQLHTRGVSSLVLDGPVDAEELLAFARWLGGPAQAADRPASPGGLTIGWVDYTTAAFDERADAAAGATPRALAAWQRVAATLLPGTPGGPSDLRTEPAEIVRAIGTELVQAEGLGVALASERLMKAGAQLDALAPEERALVKQRLAEVVANLPSEVRHQLLSVVPADDPRKCGLLTDVLDHLPAERLLELVPRVDMRRGTHVSPFLTFLVRLCSVAARDASVSEALERQLHRYGLPDDLLHSDTSDVQRLLDTAFAQTVEHYASAGDLYQSQVHALTPQRPGPDEGTLARFADAAHAGTTSEHAARIALMLVRIDPAGPGTVPCLAFARDTAGRTLGEGRVALLAELSNVAETVAAGRLEPSTRALVQECLALCRGPLALEHLVGAIGEHTGPPSEALQSFFLAAGLSGTLLALARMTTLPDGAFRDRLGSLVARQDLDIVRSALARLHVEGTPVMPVLDTLRLIDPLRTPELVRLFIRDPDPAVRRHALDLLRDAPLAPVKRERVMVQMLQDPDADIARTALADLCRHQTPGGLTALTRLLSRVDARELEPLQLDAVRLLRCTWTEGAAATLAEALRARRHGLDAGRRRVSKAMMTALEECGDHHARTAAHLWRRPAAGLLRACFGRRGSA